MSTATQSSAQTKSSAVKPVQDGMHTVTPHLVCAGAADAIEFYKKAFGATEVARMPTPDGKLMHGSVMIGDSMVMLVDEFPEMGCLGPKARNGSSVTIHLSVPNVDEFYAQAVKAGAIARMPVQDMFWGDRYGQVEDPFGHSWSIATHVKDLTPAEIAEAAKGACCG
ncbi:MAG: VOC family protein [Verrucomicrobiota bacterium]